LDQGIERVFSRPGIASRSAEHGTDEPPIGESTQPFFTAAFAENPIVVELDPKELIRRLEAGASEAELKRRADVGKRGLSDVKLR
jgi:hypothetical protein